MQNREKISFKEQFKKDYEEEIVRIFSKSVGASSTMEKYQALASLVMGNTAKAKEDTRLKYHNEKTKKVFYFSMEFLIGRLLENYLVNLGQRDLVVEALSEMGIDFNEIAAMESEPGLGSGGLGRLSACFLDSMASMGIAGFGIGLRFRFGLFKQRIHNGYQIEEPDAWLDNGFPWNRKVDSDAVIVKFGGTIERTFNNGKLGFVHKDYESVLAMPYDIPIVGYGGKTINNLRIFKALPAVDTVDMDMFNNGQYSKAMMKKNDAEAITYILYPDDRNFSGKILRIKQEYLMVAAGIASILKSYEKTFGPDWAHLDEHISIHINDTHPAFCVPELMRVLVDEKKMEWDDAWRVTVNTISYTNHTVMPEALEKWPADTLMQLLPRIYMIIEEIDRRFNEIVKACPGDWYANREKMGIIYNNRVRMANLSIVGSHSVNGVAEIHSQILKDSLFREFDQLYPGKFSNKTNGVSHRRFLIQSNPGLSSLITESIGDGWKTDPQQLKTLLRYGSDASFLEKIGKVKRENKERLAAFIAEKSEIKVDPDSIFDIQVKRIHAYKRQLLNAFKILRLYNDIRFNPNVNIRPHTFIFSGKAAQGYVFAKEVIKFICSVADKVNSDPLVSKYLKVVFIENFCVSNAQLIYPAADISEQISTAGKEASGTGNMKFMMNGAVTLGTMDGANVEIHRLVGDENIEIFGLRADEVESERRSGQYNASRLAESDGALSYIMTQLVNGFFESSGQNFWGIHDALCGQNDEYFILKDFNSYFKGWQHLGECYDDKMKWRKMSLRNIAESGFFSSDRTIMEYNRDIWHS